MTFTRSRTEQGRWRTTCDQCGLTQASWTPSLLSRWQITHRCEESPPGPAAAAS